MDVATHSTNPAPVFLPRETRFIVGCDLGQTNDPTAIAVLEHTKGVLDFNSEWERHTGCGTIAQKPAEHLDVRHLERLPLGLTYPSMVDHVQNILARPPLNGDGRRIAPAELVIDQTAVGRAVGDIFNAAGFSPIKITITAGNEVTAAGSEWHVAKTVLISTVDALLHTGILRFASRLAEASAMKDELKDFRRKLSDAGRATYAARTGAHDDLVLSVAIAAWWGTRPPPATATFGTWTWSTETKGN